MDVVTQDRRQPDHNLVAHRPDQVLSKVAFADAVALETEVGSEAASAIEEAASEGAVVSAVIEVGLAAIEAGLAAEEASATKNVAASRMAHHLLAHLADLVPEVALDPAHQMVAMTTEDAMATAAVTGVEVEVAMTPGILVVSVVATETQSETVEVGMATAKDMATDLDETMTTDQESVITRATNMMIPGRSGGIKHHIPIEVCWWVSLCSTSRLLPRPFHIKGKKVLHYYQQFTKRISEGVAV